jgi:quercetin dioxygenase-like cupin family protein
MRTAKRRVRWALAVGGVVLALGGAATLGWALGAERADPKPPVREALAQSESPRGAKGRTLALTKVTIPAGTRLALHHHPGTQIAYVQAGVLTYSVDQGSAKIKHGPADDHPRLVRKVEAGETARIRAGQWIVEQPSDHHYAANLGDKRVLLYLSTLFRRGAPPSIPG